MFAPPSFTLLPLLAALHMLISVKAAESSTPAVWPILENYLEENDGAASPLLRNTSRFWDPTKTSSFDVQRALAAANVQTGCALVIYYDKIDARLGERNNRAFISTAYGLPSYIWPLAIAPICVDGDTAQPVEYPSSSSEDETVVFWQAHANVEQDAYLILPAAMNVNAFDIGNNCVILSRDTIGALQWGGASTDDGVNALDLVTWAMDYAERQEDSSRAGCFPNPYTLGKGHELWAKWARKDFWGYSADGKRISP